MPSTDTLNASTAIFTVDGIAYRPTSVVWDGHWESDGCGSRWVPDYNAASFSASVPEVGAGPHAITFTIADASGDYATASWSIWHPAIIYFSGQTPPNGALLTEVPYIQIIL